MLKHVQVSPMRNRADSVSLRSSISCSSSLCGSPEPADIHSLRTASRASSYSSLNEIAPQVSVYKYKEQYVRSAHSFMQKVIKPTKAVRRPTGGA